MSKLDGKYRVDPATGCWNWIGSKYPNGYGRVREGGGSKRFVRAHRVSHEMHKGPIPEGLVVMHLCDNKACVNPEHLKAGTSKENTHDAIAKGLTHHSRPAPNGLTTAKLTAEDVPKVRAMYVGGLSQSAIGRIFGVHKNTIQSLLSGQSWSKVDASRGTHG